MKTENIKRCFIRMANKMGWEEVTSKNFDDEMPYSIHYCYEAIIALQDEKGENKC